MLTLYMQHVESLLDRMTQEGVQPNHISYRTAITGCVAAADSAQVSTTASTETNSAATAAATAAATFAATASLLILQCGSDCSDTCSKAAACHRTTFTDELLMQSALAVPCFFNCNNTALQKYSL
jgi:hypothetical protein